MKNSEELGSYSHFLSADDVRGTYKQFLFLQIKNEIKMFFGFVYRSERVYRTRIYKLRTRVAHIFWKYQIAITKRLWMKVKHMITSYKLCVFDNEICVNSYSPPFFCAIRWSSDLKQRNLSYMTQNDTKYVRMIPCFSSL